MGERKVLNKYFPPDFDPKKVPRLKRDAEKQICVRMMIPFSLQCNTCGEFMYRGKKFNSLKEDCIGEDYLGIRRFRFYIKCVICSQEITFKTDPEKGDYELETGASRNFESWTDKQATEDKHNKAREEEEKSDNMKQLENRTLDSKIELEIMDALDEIKAVNRRHESVDTANVLKASAARREKGASDHTVGGAATTPDEDDALIANIQFGGPKVRRLAEAGSDDSDGADNTARSGAVIADAPLLKGETGKGHTGKGKMRAAGASAQGAPLFRSARKPESALSGAEKGAPGEGEGEEEGGGGEVGADAPGSRLLSAIEAQARREADKVKAAGMGTTVVVVKRKKKKSKDKGSAGGKGGDEGSKKRKKHKHHSENGGDGGGGGGGGHHKGGNGNVGLAAGKAENGGGGDGGGSGGGGGGGGDGGGGGAGGGGHKKTGSDNVGGTAKKTGNGSVGGPAAAAGGAGAGASPLGGLNLLGSYDSSSGSDDASR